MICSTLEAFQTYIVDVSNDVTHKNEMIYYTWIEAALLNPLRLVYEFWNLEGNRALPVVRHLHKIKLLLHLYKSSFGRSLLP